MKKLVAVLAVLCLCGSARAEWKNLDDLIGAKPAHRHVATESPAIVGFFPAPGGAGVTLDVSALLDESRREVEHRSYVEYVPGLVAGQYAGDVDMTTPVKGDVVKTEQKGALKAIADGATAHPVLATIAAVATGVGVYYGGERAGLWGGGHNSSSSDSHDSTATTSSSVSTPNSGQQASGPASPNIVIRNDGSGTVNVNVSNVPME